MSFEKHIPQPIRHEITQAIANTKKHGKEESLAFCEINRNGKKRLFVGSHIQSDSEDFTIVKKCDPGLGRSEFIGDFHTHPKKSIGIGPSESDMETTLEDSFKEKKKIISCISNHISKYIHCYIPTHIPDKQKLNQYRRALIRTDERGSGLEPDKYFRENVYKDFEHIYYDRKTFNKVVPSISDLVSLSIGAASGDLRRRTLGEMKKGPFCDYMSDIMIGDDHDRNEEFRKECRIQLKKKIIDMFF